jgi:hypothetical protein
MTYPKKLVHVPKFKFWVPGQKLLPCKQTLSVMMGWPIPCHPGTLSCSNCHFQVKCFGTVLIWLTNILEKKSKNYINCLFVIEYILTIWHLYIFSIKTCSIYFNSSLVDQAENYLCFDCCILNVMVGWHIPFRPGQMSHFTQEHCYRQQLSFSSEIFWYYILIWGPNILETIQN